MQNHVEHEYMVGNLKLFGIMAWLAVVWVFLPEMFGGTLAAIIGLAGVLSVLSLPQVRPHVTRTRIFAAVGLLTVLFLIAAFLLTR